jgi:hypothetical protein
LETGSRIKLRNLCNRDNSPAVNNFRYSLWSICHNLIFVSTQYFIYNFLLSQLLDFSTGSDDYYISTAPRLLSLLSQCPLFFTNNPSIPHTIHRPSKDCLLFPCYSLYSKRTAFVFFCYNPLYNLFHLSSSWSISV